jgi:hypothetical protein
MFLVNETPLAIVIPLFAIAWRVVSVVVGIEPVIEGVRKFF